jgi:predicted  nucleic acid-binding Zn-ribbon protein
MPHKCLKCGNVYPDNDSTILRGCTHCGSIFFLYMKTGTEAQQIKEIEKELETQNTTLEKELEKQIEVKKTEVKQAEKAVEKQIQKVVAKEKIRTAKKLVRHKFGIETVRIPREGRYEINIEGLMNKRPLIILEKGKVYLIHLPSAFEAEE